MNDSKGLNNFFCKFKLKNHTAFVEIKKLFLNCSTVQHS